jgi:hypothetical protein
MLLHLLPHSTERHLAMASDHTDEARETGAAIHLWSGFGKRALGTLSAELMVVVGIIVLGTTCGIAAKAADESQLHWASNLGNFPAAWVLALALIGWLAPTPGRAALRAGAFFVAVCLAYYAWASSMMGFPVAYDIWLWTGLAASAVPVLAAAVRWTRDRHGLLPGLILATVAALAVVDGVVWQLWRAWREGGAPEWFPLRPFQALINVTVALVVAGILPRDHRTRLWAIVLLLPSAIIISGLLNDFMSLLLRLVRLI